MAVIRTKNRFGRRYIRLRELCDYAVDLDLGTHPPAAGLMEFFEAQGLLTPVRRVLLPPEIVRRLFKERYPSEPVINPLEADGPRFDAAADLMNVLNMNRWSDARVYGESIHVLDAMAPEHAPFIQTEFQLASFTPWNDHRVHLCNTKKGPLYSNNDQHAPAFYHYWQIFLLAAILRSGLHIYYPLDDKELEQEILHGPLPAGALQRKSYRSLNLEAYRELCALREYERHFEAVGYFKAYSDNAFQVYARHHDAHGRIPHKYWRQYLARERKIAKDTMTGSRLSDTDIIAFIGKQCEWWGNAHRVGPVAVAEEYKRNIAASVEFLRAATDIDPRRVVELVGRRTGHSKPTLEVIFPDWTEEQRDLTIRSLKYWADEELATLPAPFPCNETELGAFCDWLEDRGLYQYYWHFRRLVDLERRDDTVHRAASTSEVVGFASLCEMIANEVMIDRGLTPRGNTLFPKLRRIFDAHGPVDLNPLFDRFGGLVNTRSQSLPQRLSQIARIRAGGAHNPVLRALLSFMVIRNEGAHLGLLRFDHPKVVDMIRILSLASLMIWKSR